MDGKVSVIVPVYNVGAYLAECIESVLAQTYSNLELILIDDGSTDDSGSICDRYAQKDSRIIVKHIRNGGVSHARNTGLELATGEYICFIDGDDYVMPDYIEYLHRLIVTHNCDISLTTRMYTTYRRVDGQEDSVNLVTGEQAAIAILSYNVPIGVYCKMFRTSFLNGCGIRFEPDLFIGEGFNYNTDAFEAADKVATGKKKVYFYRLTNTTSATTVFSVAKWENGLLAIEKIREKLKFHDKKIIKAWEYAWWNTNRGICDLILKLKLKKDYRNFYKRCRKEVVKFIFSSLFVRVPFVEKIRPIFVLFFPRFIPWLMRQRNNRYRKKNGENS